MSRFSLRCVSASCVHCLPMVLVSLVWSCIGTTSQAQSPSGYFEIHVVDAETGRGIPLVELETVDNVRHVTDNAGRIAYAEPGQVGESVFFTIHAPGYDVPKDGFGMAGVRLVIEPEGRAEVRLRRVNLAERLYRCTGRGLYRDSVLLGYETPLEHPLENGQVAGQDSVMVAYYRGKLHWFWGDTNRLSYPLGLFRTAGATSELTANGGLSPADGINYQYFVGPEGFARNMAEVADPAGVVWIDGVCTLDADGEERMVAHFSRRRGLADPYEQGMLLYNDERELFEVATTIPLDDTWRYLQNHPLCTTDGETAYLLSGIPYPTTRVRADLHAVLDSTQYESWSCVDASTGRPRRNAAGQLDWRWQETPPVTSSDERDWLQAGLIAPDEAYYLPVDAADPERHVTLHSGSVFWNEHRRRWIMIAVEINMDRDSPSMLGEVWYTEAVAPQGPYETAVKIVTHEKQTFYNPCQHPFFDEDGGRVIYFEGTYCNTFTSSFATPRYNYNQMMYRLDLSRPEIAGAFE